MLDEVSIIVKKKLLGIEGFLFSSSLFLFLHIGLLQTICSRDSGSAVPSRKPSYLRRLMVCPVGWKSGESMVRLL